MEIHLQHLNLPRITTPTASIPLTTHPFLTAADIAELRPVVGVFDRVAVGIVGEKGHADVGGWVQAVGGLVPVEIEVGGGEGEEEGC